MSAQAISRRRLAALAVVAMVAALLPAMAVTAGAAGPPVFINEFVANHTGADSDAFVEVLGDPATDYSAFTVLEIEGDFSSTSSIEGTIDAALPVGTTNAGGYWIDDEDMENGTITILLVEDFTGSVGMDLDPDDDGVLDSTPWTRIVDSVATTDGGSSDVTYSTTVLGPLFIPFAVAFGGASRIPNGADTDTAADWVVNDFDGFGFPGFPGSPALGEAENTPGAVNAEITVLTDPIGVCNDPATLIHDIQGSGLVSPDVGSIREVEAVVTATFYGPNQIGGYFVQEEDTDADLDPATSEGLRVFDTANTPAAGDLVRIRGSVAEFFGLTELNNVVSVLSCGTGVATPATVTLPTTTTDDLERYEGMAVTFPQSLVISEYFNFDRFGEIVLTSERHVTPTAEFEPGSPEQAQAALDYLLDRITLDDGRGNQNPDPAIHPNGGVFDLDNLFRGGDTVANVTGVMDYSFGLYRIQPTQGADYTNVNPRTESPDDVGGTLHVATFNVLNYFTTLDEPGAECFPSMTRSDCRGADNAVEFTRQRDKIIAALVAIDADVVGLMEIENNGDAAVADLAAGLNDAMGAGTYDYVAAGRTGTDAIKVAIIYKPATVTPDGAYAVLDSAAFLDPANTGEDRNRAALAQTFVENATGASFTVAVNHLKSKSGSEIDDRPNGICVDSDTGNDIPDCDQGDGQSYFNHTRTLAAQVLVDWLATDPTGSGDGDVLIMGDLNSYDKEDPIDVLAGAGYADLVFDYLGEDAYSYVFDGQTGYLDYQLASPTLTPQVTGTTVWHINADEADLIDYDTSFKGPNQDAIYAPDAYRSSDHDPVIVGLALTPAMTLREATLAELSALLPTGDDQDDQKVAKAIGRIEASLDPAWWIDASTLDPKTGNFVFDREHEAVQELEKVQTADTSRSVFRILEADRQLAVRQLLSAIAEGGDPGRIAQAQANLADAAANIAAGDYANAVLDYKKAWTNAVKAR